MKLIVKLDNYNIFTYRRIRRAIGILGMGLPFVLILFSIIPFFNTPFQASISDYYYSNLRELFTGTLSAVGLFLMRYKGHGNKLLYKNDNFLTNLAGVMAIGIAFFPTNSANDLPKTYSLIPLDENWISIVHYSCAAIFFLSFAMLSLFVFTIGSSKEERKKSKWNENNIYKICGIAIIILILLVPISTSFNISPYSTFILETLSLIFFGTAWLIKGRALGDKGIIGEKVYGEENKESTEKAVDELSTENL